MKLLLKLSDLFFSLALMWQLTIFSVSNFTLQAIRNQTPFDILLIDRQNNNTFKIPTKKIKVIKIVVEGSKNPFMQNTSLLTSMQQNAQFIIKQIDPTSGQPITGKEVYMALWFATGGTHDGSGIISGKLGYPVLKFFIADKEGLVVRRHTINLKQNAKIVNVNIEFSVNTIDVNLGLFKLFGECQVIES